jgi:transcriptional regulator with XRE-family HTH domain
MLENTRALFGANVRHARLKAKLTQVQVQELTGIQQHYISELENGWHNPTLDAWLQTLSTTAAWSPSAENHQPSARALHGETQRNRLA